jgi:hypothetical protein
MRDINCNPQHQISLHKELNEPNSYVVIIRQVLKQILAIMIKLIAILFALQHLIEIIHYLESFEIIISYPKANLFNLLVTPDVIPLMEYYDRLVWFLSILIKRAAFFISIILFLLSIIANFIFQFEPELFLHDIIIIVIADVLEHLSHNTDEKLNIFFEKISFFLRIKN